MSKKLIVVLLVVLSLALFVVECFGTEKYRMWTDRNGRKVEAKLVRVNHNGTVTLMNKRGNPFIAPIRGFVDEDIAYIQGDRSKELRTWNDITGRFSILARLVEQTESSVVLEKEDGERITVSVASLSNEDQELILEHKRQVVARQQASKPPIPEGYREWKMRNPNDREQWQWKSWMSKGISVGKFQGYSEDNSNVKLVNPSGRECKYHITQFSDEDLFFLEKNYSSDSVSEIAEARRKVIQKDIEHSEKFEAFIALTEQALAEERQYRSSLGIDRETPQERNYQFRIFLLKDDDARRILIEEGEDKWSKGELTKMFFYSAQKASSYPKDSAIRHTSYSALIQRKTTENLYWGFPTYFCCWAIAEKKVPIPIRPLRCEHRIFDVRYGVRSYVVLRDPTISIVFYDPLMPDLPLWEGGVSQDTAFVVRRNGHDVQELSLKVLGKIETVSNLGGTFTFPDLDLLNWENSDPNLTSEKYREWKFAFGLSKILQLFRGPDDELCVLMRQKFPYGEHVGNYGQLGRGCPCTFRVPISRLHEEEFQYLLRLYPELENSAEDIRKERGVVIAKVERIRAREKEVRDTAVSILLGAAAESLSEQLGGGGSSVTSGSSSIPSKGGSDSSANSEKSKPSSSTATAYTTIVYVSSSGQPLGNASVCLWCDNGNGRKTDTFQTDSRGRVSIQHSSAGGTIKVMVNGDFVGTCSGGNTTVRVTAKSLR